MMKCDQQGSKWKNLLLLLLLFVETGCQTSVFESELPEDIPAVWSFEHEIKQTPMSNSIVQFIKDDALVAYLEQVSKNNPDLESIRSSLVAQEYRTGMSGAQLWPSLTLNGSIAKNNQTPDILTGAMVEGRTQRLGVGMSWEADLWGKLKDAHRADLTLLRASEWQYYAIKDALIARATQSWIRSASLKKSLEIAKNRVNTLEELLARISNRYSGGLEDVSELDAARTRLMIGQVELTEVHASYDQSLRVLRTYAGAYSGAELSVDLKFSRIEFPDVLTPSDVLFNRPDVQIALANVEASLYLQRSVRKRSFPSLVFGGNYGRESIRFEDLLNAQNVWNWALSVSKTLFDGGMEKSERNAVEWESKAALSDLRSVVMKAVLEIHDVVAKERKMDRQIFYLREGSITASNNFKHYEKRYLDGLDPIILMLNAKEEQFRVEAQLNELQAARLVNRIDTILALGYGERQ